MLIDMKGRYGAGLQLGFQTNPENRGAAIKRLTKFWAPAKAKSATISDIINTDRYGNPKENVTGYGNFYVKYYTTMKEGEVVL